MKKLVPVWAAVWLLATTTVVRADTVLTAVGDPVNGGCFNQKFEVSGGKFNEIQVEMVSPGALERPAVSNFSSPSWSSVGGDWVTEVACSGPAGTDLAFDVTFGGSSSTSLQFNFQAYDKDTLVCSYGVSYNGCGFGSGWSCGPPCGGKCPPPIVTAPVPEPVSMIFFGTGLVAVGGYMARRRMLRNA